MPRLVPELLVTDLAASLRFWCGACGFSVAWERPEEGFACIEREGARVMLEEAGAPGRHFVTAPMHRPFGRGMNLEIQVSALAPILDALARDGWPAWLGPEEKWYRVGAAEHGQRQVLVQDPDGYLLRFCEALGERPAGLSPSRTAS